MRYRPGNKAGFTLIEVVISMLLLTAALYGVFLGFSVGMRWAKNLSHRTTALGLAQAKMEEMLKQSYASVVPGIEQDFPLIEQGRIATDSDNLSGTRNVIVTQLSGCKEVRVTVVWPEFGNQYSEELVSVLYP